MPEIKPNGHDLKKFINYHMKLQEYKMPEREPNGHNFNLGCNKKLEEFCLIFFENSNKIL